MSMLLVILMAQPYAYQKAKAPRGSEPLSTSFPAVCAQLLFFFFCAQLLKLL